MEKCINKIAGYSILWYAIVFLFEWQVFNLTIILYIYGTHPIRTRMQIYIIAVKILLLEYKLYLALTFYSLFVV